MTDNNQWVSTYKWNIKMPHSEIQDGLIAILHEKQWYPIRVCPGDNTMLEIYIKGKFRHFEKIAFDKGATSEFISNQLRECVEENE